MRLVVQPRPASATVTTSTMQALPMITPSMVSRARTLLPRSACNARLQVSPHNNGVFFGIPSSVLTEELDAGACCGDTGAFFTGMMVRSMRALLQIFQARLGVLVARV